MCSPSSMDLETQIASNIPWPALSSKLRTLLRDDPKEYDNKILAYSLQNQLRYRGNIIQQVVRREKYYYEKLVAYSRQEYLLYPYHLQDKIVPGLRITPFTYYRDMLIQLVRAERSYDSLPNFTAADCLRLLGIGRNQYIDIVNTYKSFLTTAGPDEDNNLYEILYDILPCEPVAHIHFEPWYIVHVGAVLVEDMEQSTEAEKDLIDRIIDSSRLLNPNGASGLPVADMDDSVLQQLHRRGLVYIDVPIQEDDCIGVPTLEGFVMNRVNGDSRENLLYKIFVSADEKITIKELAECLQIDVNLVAQAASVFCRLGFAYKRTAVGNLNVSTSTADEDKSSFPSPALTSNSNPSSNYESTMYSASPDGARPPKKKLALIFDSTVTAYLMMGNLSTGLKPHAVTMYEVGKLSDDALESFLAELDNLSSIDEGEAKLYYEHAVNLREAIHFLRAQSKLDSTDFYGVDLIRVGSLLSLCPATRIRILEKHYNLIVSLSPLTYEDRQASSASWPVHIGPPVPEANSPWFRLFASYLAGRTQETAEDPLPSEDVLPVLLLPRGSRLNRLPECFSPISRFMLIAWGHDPVLVNANILLNSVNDMLLSSTVLVQACDIYTEDLKLYQRFIPLPLSKHIIYSQNDSPPVPAFVHRLSKHLDLCSLTGYITVLAPSSCEPGQAQETDESFDSFSDPTIPPSMLQNDQEPAHSHPYCVLSESELIELVKNALPVYFITLNLGLPIFSGALLRAVCSQMTESSVTNALSVSHRPLLKAANTVLVSRLNQFLRTVCKAEWPAASSTVKNGTISTVVDQLPGPWPLPTRRLLCIGGQMTTSI
ncbi:Protein fam91a1 [Clonorchis sinensis]|uniref:Protein fam91a1 n=1 Tax=Clonorchis sinensis TaxID=79923 RepID=A0A419Q8V2_CLOSI|nr:Protein fam91a1 [Clonorchis sinensis]